MSQEILVYNDGFLTKEDASKHKRISRDEIKRIVVKSGTGVITNSKKYCMNLEVMARIAEQLSEIRMNSTIDVVYVTSGAIGFGMMYRKLTQRPTDSCELQFLSTIGQPILYRQYLEFFRNHRIDTSQVLVNEHDLESKQHIERLSNVFDLSLKKGVVPIVNANDATWAYEIEHSDNDYIAALLAEKVVKADLLIVLSNTKGLFTGNPDREDSQFINHVCTIDDKLRGYASGKSVLGSGGASSKLKIAQTYHGPYVVADGKRPHAILDIIEGKPIGTYFEGRK